MASLLVKVKTKLSIHSRYKIQGLLEGEYASVFKGRSMDFDDLREYVPGDDIKDIDWKATARSSQTLIKRYVAIRKHNILLVVDTGRNMSALCPSLQSKKDLAVLAAGIMGYVAQKHGDLVGAVVGNEKTTSFIPLKTGNAHLEQILQTVDRQISDTGPKSDIFKQLDYVARHMRRRMVLLIVTDEQKITDEQDRLLRRLAAQHELMWITIADANPTDEQLDDKIVEDVQTFWQAPYFMRRSESIRQAYEAAASKSKEEMTKRLDRLQINNQYIVDDRSTVTRLFNLLKRQRYAKRR